MSYNKNPIPNGLLNKAEARLVQNNPGSGALEF